MLVQNTKNIGNSSIFKHAVHDDAGKYSISCHRVHKNTRNYSIFEHTKQQQSLVQTHTQKILEIPGLLDTQCTKMLEN